VRVVVLGLDKAGKSSVLNALKPAGARSARVVPTPPAGAATERIHVHTPHGTIKLVALDVSGDQARAARLWPPHYGAAQGVVWVVDATDALRVQMAQDALDRQDARPRHDARRATVR
jgi:GTPase SAR1 family protein